MNQQSNFTHQQNPQPETVTIEHVHSEIMNLNEDCRFIDSSIQSSIHKLILDYIKCLRNTFRLAEQKKPAQTFSVHSAASYNGIQIFKKCF
eukprot:UN22449